MAAVSLAAKVQPREIVYDRSLLEQVRHGLCGGTEGVPLLLYPWRDLKPDDPWFVAVNRLSVSRLLQLEVDGVDFNGNEERTSKMNDIVDVIQTLHRGKYADELWNLVTISPFPPFERESQTDADGDGILDVDDALLFTPNEPIVWKVEEVPLLPENDGLVDADIKASSKCFDFAGKGVPAAEGFVRDRGQVYSSERGFGWARDITANARVRNRMPEPERDAFIFTREDDVWEVNVENGDYEVTVCVGDSGHEQKGQFAVVEGKLVITDVDTTTGRFHEAAATVSVSDGCLSLTIGRPEGGSNTALCWIALRKME